MKLQFAGTYPVRQISRGESVIHIPKEVTGDFAIYVNPSATVVVLRKQQEFRVEKFLKDMEVRCSEDSVPLDEAKEMLGIKL